MTDKAEAEALLPLFKTESLLNQDQDGRRVSLYGKIHEQPAVLVIERAPLPSAVSRLASIPTSLATLRNLGANDVYRWYLGSSGGGGGGAADDDIDADADADVDLKLNLFWPATEKHVKKYSAQRVRLVHETPALYADAVVPRVLTPQREPARLRWIYDILDGRAEADDVIFRTPPTMTTTAAVEPSTGFVLLPDLNWDRRTTEALHLLALVERRDVSSVRDLRRAHVPWLRAMRRGVVEAALARFPALEADQLKLYMHYPPTYFHLHIHVVHVALEGGATQAVGKAIGLDAVIAQLDAMAGGDGAGMQDVTLTYTVGEESDLWREVFEPLKKANAVVALSSTS